MSSRRRCLNMGLYRDVNGTLCCAQNTRLSLI